MCHYLHHYLSFLKAIGDFMQYAYKAERVSCIMQCINLRFPHWFLKYAAEQQQKREYSTIGTAYA